MLLKRSALSKRSIRRLLLTIGLCLGIAIPTYFVLIDQIFRNAVPRALELGFRPDMTALNAVPDEQTENHTCGLHALNAIYRAHGLVPKDHKLRMRLGVDRPAIPILKSTQGVLQPDICRVLAQDGFQVSVLDLSGFNVEGILVEHFSKSWKALALIRKPDNGALHWVVLESMTEFQLTVIDSQKPMPELVSFNEFLQKQAITVFLVVPNSEPKREDIAKAHALGVIAMKQTPDRLSALDE